MRPQKSSTHSSDAKHAALQNTPDKPAGLKESLTEQLRLRNIPDRIREIGEDIISSLDSRGYLGCEPEELGDWIEGMPATAEVRQAFDAVRGLEPAGVGATDLQDCLLLQLQRDGQDYHLEETIIRNHLQDLSQNKLPRLARRLGCPVEDIKEAAEIISSLDPMPGRRMQAEETVYIRPDVLVEELDGDLEISVLDYSLPQLEISRSCRTALRNAEGDRRASSFLRKKIESAKWLIQALEQRQRTIKDIAVAIVEFQRDFMLEGPEHIKALKMQTIADTVGVHLSTISRAIKGKYIETPSGIYELRYFFTGGVDNADGEIESRRNVSRRIGELIDGENKKKPYSDTALARLLQDEGLRIARRTVTKYREQADIPASRLRRSY
jgi:RNA polymerase sigma-54 factor